MRGYKLICIIISGFAFYGASIARADDGDRFHFDLGISYVSGMNSIYNDLKHDIQSSWYNLDTYSPNGSSSNPADFTGASVPVGLTLTPYYQWGFGLGVGGDVGPIEGCGFTADVPTGGYNSYYGYYYGGYKTVAEYAVIVPLGLDARYTLFADSDSWIQPYARLGFRYPIPIVSDSILTSAEPGVYAGVGVDFTRIHLGVEAAFDSSSVDVSANNGNLLNGTGPSKREMPNEFTLTLFVHF
jgi:hypothetical protein